APVGPRQPALAQQPVPHPAARLRTERQPGDRLDPGGHRGPHHRRQRAGAQRRGSTALGERPTLCPGNAAAVSARETAAQLKAALRSRLTAEQLAWWGRFRAAWPEWMSRALSALPIDQVVGIKE